ncbi:MAG: HNH endonuclease signature motif containing protein [Prevotella sp.]|nr:HNH endonuclease signature motif containing protein [Prevotella sp.]
MPTLNKPKKKRIYAKNERNSEIANIYNSKQWKDLRNLYLLEHPLCEKCLEQGKVSGTNLSGTKVSATEEIHHIRKISSGRNEKEMKEIAYDYGNLMALCKECHHKIHNNKIK